MTAPADTTRTTPGGLKLKDGYSTKIAFSLDADISLWEKTITPPGIDGGDAIEQTTMHNEEWRTFAPRALKTLTEMQCTCAYDPAVYTQIKAIINREGAITLHFSDGSKLSFFGFVRTFEPGEVEEGSPPEATVTIQPTMFDPASATYEEEDFVLTSVPGT